MSDPSRPGVLRRTAALIAAGLLSILAGCSGVLPGTTGSVAANSAPAVAGATTPSPTPRVDLIDYTQITGLPDGVIIRTPEAVAALSGAPQDFRDYLAAQLKEASRSTACPVSFGVQLVRTDGYAVGTIRGCDTLRVVWAKQGGTWAQVASGAQGLDCSALQSHGVPLAIAGPHCLQGATLVPYGSSTPVPSPRVTPSPAGGQLYTNPRYGFRCLLPQGWALRESPNGDGVTATDPTGAATASCFGRNRIGDGTTAGEQAAARAALVGAGVDITYASRTDSTYVLSGTRPDGTITYQWYAVGAGSSDGVAWSYPARMKAALDRDVTASVDTFRPGDLTSPH